MTVQELIDHLRRLPPDDVVLVEGYENGWDSLIAVEHGHVTPQAPREEWDGEFEKVVVDAATTSAVLLVGKRGHRRKAP